MAISISWLRQLVCVATVFVITFTPEQCRSQSSEAAPPALYQAAQAERGKKVYATTCATCHGKRLVGGTAPALTGAQFFTREMNTRLGGLFQYVAQQMPAGRPGSLTHDQYADLMAFILQKNGFPAGDAPLAYDAALKSDDIIYFANH